jgi:hypothetical protein
MPANSRELGGLVIQKFEGLFAADSVPDSIEAPILCQTSADHIRSLFGLPREDIQLMIHFLIPDGNSFQFRNAIQ